MNDLNQQIEQQNQQIEQQNEENKKLKKRNRTTKTTNIQSAMKNKFHLHFQNITPEIINKKRILVKLMTNWFFDVYNLRPDKSSTK